jgi:GT2 family glycosyltransferase
MIFAASLIALASLPLLAASAYLFALTLLSRRLAEPAASARDIRFDVIVPAHDEEAGIGRTVAELRALEYPKDAFRIRVVADNCSDATADRARAAGAEVWARRDDLRRGKGHALQYAFERSLAEGFADAVVVIDADTVASANLLRAFAARLASGASAVQADYRVGNADASWRTRLMSVAFTLFHQVRSLGRERLQLSCGLRGNGMCFARQLLLAVPHRAFSIVEDVEYGVQLGRAGVRVHFAHEASVLSDMVASERASRSQRQRWEGGRRVLARQIGLALLAEALRKRSALLGDLAVDLLVPPLAQLGALIGAGVASAAIALAAGHGWALVPWCACAVMLAIYILRGWQLSGAGLGGLAALARAPIYLIWKVWLSVRQSGRARGEWVRTARQGEWAR